jgi:hypothetical protein
MNITTGEDRKGEEGIAGERRVGGERGRCVGVKSVRKVMYGRQCA